MMRRSRSKPQLYEAMAQAISYIREHAGERPSLKQVARKIGMSQSRFEHAFTEWVGTTPKRFQNYLSTQQAKSALAGGRNVLGASLKAGMSGPGRLHDLMVKFEAVSPGEFKSGQINITYGLGQTPFGWAMIALTKRGICQISFLDSESEAQAANLVKEAWPKAELRRDDQALRKYFQEIFRHKSSGRPIHLLVKGTNFQIKVWKALLAIPAGEHASYSQVAQKAGFPKAIRAVGTACGRNNLAVVIPCHRVLAADGGIGGYRWGVGRKQAILAWESLPPLA